MSPLMNASTTEQDWEKKAQEVLFAIRRSYARKKGQLSIDINKAVSQTASRHVPNGMLDPVSDAPKVEEEENDSFLNAATGWLPPVWLFSTYLVQNLMKRNVINTMTNRYFLVTSCAQSSSILTLFSLAVDILLYTWRSFDEAPDKATQTTPPPWSPSNLLSTVAIGIVAGFMNFGVLSVSFVGIRPVILSFIVMVIVSVTITKFQDAVNDLGFCGACKNYLATAFLPGPKEWTGCRASIPHDLCCPISQEPFVDPVILNGMVFEREFVRRWIIDNGTHPIDRDKSVSVCDLQPCPQMVALVKEYARQQGMRKVARSALL